MNLKSNTVLPVIELWAESLQESWTKGEQQYIAEQIVKLSSYVTPHVVEDVSIQDEEIQTYLLAKTLSRVDDWLIRIAARYRRMHRVDNPDKVDALLDLRSTTLQEIIDLSGVEDVLAEAVARYVTQRPKLASMDELSEIKGIGEKRLAELKERSEIGFPTLGLMSQSLWDFILSPSITTLLKVFEQSDTIVFFGTQYSISNYVSETRERIYDRFIAFLKMVIEQAARVYVAVGGALASEAQEWLRRHQIRELLLKNMKEANGGILINDAYVSTARRTIEAAQNSVNLMVFLGTLAKDQDDDPGPAQLVQALETAHTRGVEVRVIVDRDERTDPYKSYLINSPLVKRLKSSGVPVKFDEPETLLHSKVLITDHNKVILGSHNWTRNSFNNIHELSIYIENAHLAKQYHERFNALWNRL